MHFQVHYRLAGQSDWITDKQVASYSVGAIVNRLTHDHGDAIDEIRLVTLDESQWMQ